MKGSNSKVLQVLSKRQRWALGMLDFQVECRAKTLRTRGSTSKTMQIPQKCTVLSPNCCKGHITQGIPVFFECFNFFYPQGNIYFFDPSPSLYCRSQHHQHHQTYTSLHSSQCFTQAHTRAHTQHTHTPTHTLVICSFTTPSASSPYLSS